MNPVASPVPVGVSASSAILSVSVIVITRGRPDALRACLDSLASCEPLLPREVFVVMNGPDEPTRRFLEERSAAHPGLRWRALTRPSKGRARNLGAREAAGEWLYFVDDDVVVAPGIVRDLAAAVRAHPRARVFGGPNLTPPDSGSFQRSVGFVLESRWGAGRMRRRYVPMEESDSADDRSLISCNLVLHESLFRSQGVRFPDDFFYNEENVLLEELRRRGVGMAYVPSLAVYHKRRERWPDFLKQVWRSGVGRGHQTRRAPGSLRPEFLAPLVWLLYAATLPFREAGWAAAPLAAYAAVTIAEAVRFYLVRERSVRAAVRTAFLFAGGHLAYGAGFLCGLLWTRLNSPDR